MPNLKSRLQLIRKNSHERHEQYKHNKEIVSVGSWCLCGSWQKISEYVVYRSQTLDFPYTLPMVDYEPLFFDLETTGLSGGAGTVAFLAAFGRINREPRQVELIIDQYLLLDYPGEADFLDAILPNFQPATCYPLPAPCIVSYNGKTFDAQILKNRCLMNGIRPPEYRHIDMLHPARRLWKGLLPNCSQASIETGILGLDRSDDLPGSFAPEAWFSFLKTGEADNLLRIAEHNAKDISGLAAIWAVVNEIERAPLESRYSFDLERLALYRRRINREPREPREQDFVKDLLYQASHRGGRRAALALAIDEEWRYRDYAAALRLTEWLLETEQSDELLRRQARLKKKLGCIIL
jgi:uncharacterized protein YprB with RNaseH-like and TPR domain